jgi:paraquat-inducible protein B
MAEPDPTPQARIAQGRRLRLSYIWIVPLIAAALGGWLVYKAEVDVGPTITITFEQGTNIAHDARLIYRGVEVGKVRSVTLDPSLERVNVQARLNKPAAGLAREGSQFWIVEPEVGVGGITGLSTLVSGSYIQIAPGGGAAATSFVGLPAPPVVPEGEQVLTLVLEADDASMLGTGDAVTYRGVEVGAITKVALPKDGPDIRIELAIDREHAELVRANSIFWLASGIRFDLSLLNPGVEIGSLASLIRGGVAFATPEPEGDPASAGTVFPLADNPPEALTIAAAPPGLRITLSTPEANMLPGAPVYHRGVEVGEVLRSGLNADASAVDVEVVIGPAHAALVNTHSVFWNVSGVRAEVGAGGAHVEVQSLRTLVAGGIAFATEGTAGAAVESGASFPLLPQAPASPAAPGGRHFVLVADSLGSARAGDPVYHRDVQVGTVARTWLVPDGSAAALEVAIADQHADLVRERSVFWNASGIDADLSLLHPSLDIESLRALLRGGIAFGTPADGGAPAAADTEFRLYGAAEGRRLVQRAAPGLHVVLSARQLGSVAVGDPVYYREVEVGEVTATGLQDGAATVLLHAVIRPRYAPLVQAGTVFWNASGARFDWSLFKGASFDVESLKSLLAGGIAFATPEVQGEPAADGSQFPLHDRPDDAWLAWQPAVHLGPADAAPALPRVELAAATDVAVEDEAPASYAVRSAAHVREGPGTTYRVIDTLAGGTTVEVTGQVLARDWYRVRLADGRVGYVWEKLLEPAGPTAAH